jgi:hypothetical protein
MINALDMDVTHQDQIYKVLEMFLLMGWQLIDKEMLGQYTVVGVIVTIVQHQLDQVRFL